MKKRLLAIALVFGMVIAQAGVVAADSAAEAPVSTDPIKVGVITPLSGNASTIGEGCVNAVNMALDEANWEVCGRKIELTVEDSPESATICIEKTERLVQRDGVQVILGPLGGAEGAAIKQYAPNIPDTTIIVAGSAAESVTMRGIEPNVFRTSYTGSQVTFALGTYAYEELGYRKVATIAANYDFPFAQVAGFVLTFVRSGGEVVDRLWVEQGSTDYSSIVTKIPEGIDAMYCCLTSSDAINFLSTLQSMGRFGEFAILGGTTFVDTYTLESDVGYLLEDVYASGHWAEDLPYEEAKTFMAAFEEKFGTTPTLWATDYYIATQWFLKAAEEVGGNIEDLDAFREAIMNVNYNSARGPVRMDEFHNVVENVYITHVEKNADGKLVTVPIVTLEDQDQFGPFDPDWYQDTLGDPDETNPTNEAAQSAILKAE